MVNKTTSYFASRVFESLQDLEEIGGPDTTEQYVAVMTIIKLEIERRIACALALDE